MEPGGLDDKGLELVAAKVFPAQDGLVEVVDFLNRSLKQEGFVFGVSKAGGKMTVAVYRTAVKE